MSNSHAWMLEIIPALLEKDQKSMESTPTLYFASLAGLEPCSALVVKHDYSLIEF